jgi:hypothetical protein
MDKMKTKPHSKKRFTNVVLQCICIVCGKSFTYERKNGKRLRGLSKTKCPTCLVNTRRTTLKAKIIQHLGGKCIRCGYSESKFALCCHHIDRNRKTFTISGSHCKSWAKIEEELKNCVLLCQNCHHSLHGKEWDLTV